jgi:uncharacterized coiled-coil DUF342 family protein
MLNYINVAKSSLNLKLENVNMLLENIKIVKEQFEKIVKEEKKLKTEIKEIKQKINGQKNIIQNNKNLITTNKNKNESYIQRINHPSENFKNLKQSLNVKKNARNCLKQKIEELEKKIEIEKNKYYENPKTKKNNLLTARFLGLKAGLILILEEMQSLKDAFYIPLTVEDLEREHYQFLACHPRAKLSKNFLH